MRCLKAGHMTKKQREQVLAKTGGKCAYCGCHIEIGKMQVDHIVPLFRGHSAESLASYKMVKGDDHIDNYNPACARCNKWKGTWTVEQFRREIGDQIERLNKYSANYRLAKSYGIIEETTKPVVFYFETISVPLVTG